MTRLVHCKKLGKRAPGLDYPPYPGDLGQKIYDEISQQAWETWMSQQTMLINEYKLNLMEDKSRQFLEAEMQKFLFGGNSEKPPGYSEPNKD